jgi:hypothetical protein
MQFNLGATAQQQQRVRSHAADSDPYTCFNLLTGPELLDQVESLLPPHRERLFPPTETLSMFLAQAQNADRSCQAVVNHAAVTRLIGGLPNCSTHTGAYCRARQRLPIEMVTGLACYTGRLMSERAPEVWHWRGRPVRLVDGATVAMPDTAANQTDYPQPTSTALFCFIHGSVMADLRSPLRSSMDHDSLPRRRCIPTRLRCRPRRSPESAS